MSTSYDVAILGLGAMGGATAYHLAKRGQRVIGIDLHSPPHTKGSSHGKSRMIREAYYEHPLYVPLVQRAYALWGELERAAGDRSFFIRTGGLMVGAEAGALVRGTLRSCEEHHLPHEVITSRDLHRRYPAFSPLDEMVGVLEQRAGILLPEAIVQAHLELAVHHGAVLRLETRVDGWDHGSEGVTLRLGEETVHARQLVVAAGAFVGDLLPELGKLLTVERRPIHWFDPVRFPEYFTPQRMPVSIWELENGTIFYTKPDLGDGVKIGIHHGGESDRRVPVGHPVSDAEDAEIYDLLRRFVPFAKGHPRERAICRYTMAPDAHFIVDRHPQAEDVLVLSACSGHGFKFASVIGEAAADLLTSGACAFDLSPFSLRRFGAGGAPLQDSAAQ